MSILTRREYNAALRQDLLAFIHRFFLELHHNDKFLPNWHLHVLVDALMEVYDGKTNRLILNLPPRSLKSFAVSVAFVAYWLGHRPNAKIICASYGQDLASKLARDCRLILTSSTYRTLFPAFHLTQNAADEMETNQGGFRMATSVNGVLTGRGCDLFILDDILKPDDALSDAIRKRTNEWFFNSAYSRLNNKNEGIFIVVSQRTHEEDLTGVLMAQGGWKVLSLPAIAPEHRAFVVKTKFGTFNHTWHGGEALHANRESIESLEATRRVVGEYNFAGQYLQSPAPLDGGMVKLAWFKRYDLDHPPVAGEIIQSWDTANKPNEMNDFSVCTTWLLADKCFFLRNVFRKQLDYPGLKRAALEQAAQFKPTHIVIEDKSSGTSLIQELRESGLPVRSYTPKDNKIMRLNSQSAYIESGRVYVPEQAHWLGEYLHEMTIFPNGKFDDQVDSTSQMLAWSTERFPGWGLLKYYQERAAEGASHGPMLIRLKAPSTFLSSHLGLIDGRMILMPPDGIIEVSEEDLPTLLGLEFTRVVPN